MIDMVLAVEKSGYIDVYAVGKLVEGLASEAGKVNGLRMGIVVYASQALPLLDPVREVERVPEAYREAPVLPGAPNPVPALREAADMLGSSRDPLTAQGLVVLVWSAKSRPKPSLRLASMQLLAMGYGLAAVLLLSKEPAWAKRYLGGSTPVYLLRGNANPYRLGARIAREVTQLG